MQLAVGITGVRTIQKQEAHGWFSPVQELHLHNRNRSTRLASTGVTVRRMQACDEAQECHGGTRNDIKSLTAGSRGQQQQINTTRAVVSLLLPTTRRCLRQEQQVLDRQRGTKPLKGGLSETNRRCRHKQRRMRGGISGNNKRKVHGWLPPVRTARTIK
jgi:hypothetical protein